MRTHPFKEGGENPLSDCDKRWNLLLKVFNFPMFFATMASNGDVAVTSVEPSVCELCGLTLSSTAQLEQHRAGKAHKRRVSVMLHSTSFPAACATTHSRANVRACLSPHTH